MAYRRLSKPKPLSRPYNRPCSRHTSSSKIAVSSLFQWKFVQFSRSCIYIISLFMRRYTSQNVAKYATKIGISCRIRKKSLYSLLPACFSLKNDTLIIENPLFTCKSTLFIIESIFFSCKSTPLIIESIFFTCISTPFIIESIIFTCKSTPPIIGNPLFTCKSTPPIIGSIFFTCGKSSPNPGDPFSKAQKRAPDAGNP